MQKYTKVTKWLQNESLITSLITCIVINLNDQSSQITFKVIAPQILYLQRKRCGGDYNYQASIFFSFFGELSLSDKFCSGTDCLKHATECIVVCFRDTAEAGLLDEHFNSLLK